MCALHQRGVLRLCRVRLLCSMKSLNVLHADQSSYISVQDRMPVAASKAVEGDLKQTHKQAKCVLLHSQIYRQYMKAKVCQLTMPRATDNTLVPHHSACLWTYDLLSTGLKPNFDTATTQDLRYPILLIATTKRLITKPKIHHHIHQTAARPYRADNQCTPPRQSPY